MFRRRIFPAWDVRPAFRLLMKGADDCDQYVIDNLTLY